MEAVMRVEVVTSTIELKRVCERLRDVGIVSYSIVPNVQGQGERGRQGGDDLTGVSENSYLLTTCTRQQLPRVVEAIRVVLKESGGECLVSDVMRIKH